jgi:hypothetical protein
MLVSLPLHSSFAAPLPGSALESVVGRYLLGETSEGLDLMTWMLGHDAQPSDVDEFLNRYRDAKTPEASQLEARIADIRADLHRAQVQRAGGQEVAETDSFTAEERYALREAAARELKIDERWRSADPHPGEIEFTLGDRPAGLQASREEFLAPNDEEAIQVPETPGEKAPEEIKARAKRGMREWYDDSQACLQNRPASASASAEWKYLAQQWAISAGTTAAGYVFTTGLTRVQLPSFGMDMLMSLISQGVGMKWMGSADTFQVRWLKTFAWAHGKTVLDAEVYRYNPWTDTGGVPMDQAVTSRRDFNYAWNASTSWISPVMYTVLNGIDCLLDQEAAGGAAGAVAKASRFKKGAFVFRSGVSVGSSVLYYKIWKNHH